MLDVTTITWQALTSALALSGLLVIILELLKRAGCVAGTRAIYLTGLILGQALAQVAFWRVRSPWTAHVAADAFLVGLAASIIALGGHTMLRRLLDQARNGNPPPPTPPADPADRWVDQ